MNVFQELSGIDMDAMAGDEEAQGVSEADAAKREEER
jgi:hypothetical protein